MDKNTSEALNTDKNFSHPGDFLNLVVVGHVDHGKSTIIGRLLADANSLPQGKLEQVRETCRRNSKPFEYAFLLDALKDEQAQGITIDAARCFFKTKNRQYIIIDAPGHVEFIKNMVTGAARAQAALLVIDAKEGVKENSKRHGHLLSMLGISQVAVVINKMDLVSYSEEVFNAISAEYSDFLSKINIRPQAFIPASGFLGENIFSRSDKMPWFKGYTVLEQLEAFKPGMQPTEKPFRMSVQGCYKFTNSGDDRRIIAGTVDTGCVGKNDEIVFYPSGKKTTVGSLEVFNAPAPDRFCAGEACGFTMTDQIYITRGEIAAKSGELPPCVSARIKVRLFWLGKQPLSRDKKYFLKIGTAKVGMQVEEVLGVLDSANLCNIEAQLVNTYDAAECILALERAVAYDLSENIDATSRFVIVDEYEISGGGIVTEALRDNEQWIREKVIYRNSKWEKSLISSERRAEKYNQKPALIFITGPKHAEKKEIAKALEKELFEQGKIVYFMGIANVLYGVDADIKIEHSMENREEQMRRLAETVYLMIDAGMIVIVTASDLTKSDINIIKAVIPGQKAYFVLLVSKDDETDIQADLTIFIEDGNSNNINTLKGLIENGNSARN